MKILHLLQSNRFSGAENVVCQIIAMMQDKPNIEMVYCSRDGQIREALAERGISFVPIRELTVKEVKRMIKEQEPDLVHAHDMRASFVAALSCARPPLISHIHNNNYDSRGLTTKSLAYLFAAYRARRILWVSQSAYDGYIFHKWVSKKSSVLYNMIDIDALVEKMHHDTKVYDYDVVFVGRLTEQKNPQRLMQIYKRAYDIAPNLKFAVVGTGDLEEDTKRLASELGIQKGVCFLGYQNNPVKIMHDSKVMLMSSRWEGTPMCALEAMALGVPIISTPTDGIAVLVDDGVNGFTSDEDQLLAEKIVDVCTNEELRKRLSAAAKEKARTINDKDEYRMKLLDSYFV